MATMLDDYRNMDVRGANIKNGENLLWRDEWSLDRIVAPGIWFVRKTSQKVLEYNKKWTRVPQKEKRDVIAALRRMEKSARIGFLIAKIISVL